MLESGKGFGATAPKALKTNEAQAMQLAQPLIAKILQYPLQANRQSGEALQRGPSVFSWDINIVRGGID